MKRKEVVELKKGLMKVLDFIESDKCEKEDGYMKDNGICGIIEEMFYHEIMTSKEAIFITMIIKRDLKKTKKCLFLFEQGLVEPRIKWIKNIIQKPIWEFWFI